MIIGSGRPKTGRPKKGSYREGRDRKLCIRLSYTDLKKLQYVCDIYGLTKSDFVIAAIDSAVKEVIKRGHNIRRRTN